MTMHLGLKEQQHVMKERDVKVGASCRGPPAIAPGDHVLHREILHRKAKWVKLHGIPIVSIEMMNR
jgi:hypothetical protein